MDVWSGTAGDRTVIVIYERPTLYERELRRAASEIQRAVDRFKSLAADATNRVDLNRAARRSFHAAWRIGQRRPRLAAVAPPERTPAPRRARACSTSSRHMVTP